MVRPGWEPLLPRFGSLLCKTRNAETIFSGFGCATEYVGFTSDDRHLVECFSMFFAAAASDRDKRAHDRSDRTTR